MRRSPIMGLYESQPVQILISLLIYGFYATVIGMSLVPSVSLLAFAVKALSVFGVGFGFRSILLLAIAAGASVYLYFICGSTLMAFLIRLLSWRILPGRYPKISFTTLRWLVYSGIHTIAMRSILPFIPVSYFSNLYFLICGAKMGRNVYINTFMINDSYLLTLEEGVIVGGDAEISCHIMERDHLVLSPICIKRNSLIGTGAYISPGVTVGENCTIGARCYVRKGVQVPDGSVYTVVAGLPMRAVFEIEKKAGARR